MIKLTEFLVASGIPLNLESYKVHLATMGSSHPLDAFYSGSFKEWQERQTRKNFGRDMVVGLIELNRNKWLFAGVYKILGYRIKSAKWISYDSALLGGQEELIGRVVVHHERAGRAAYLIGKPDGGSFFLSHILEEGLSIEDFPGYNSVSISQLKLKTIINQKVRSWHGALSSVNGVYLITDTKTGKVYVGSAGGNEGIWQRWSDYANDGHGGNKDLTKLIREKGKEYALNFQYAILEIADTHANEEYILARESHWKNVLSSREHGYNSN